MLPSPQSGPVPVHIGRYGTPQCTRNNQLQRLNMRACSCFFRKKKKKKGKPTRVTSR